MERILSNEDRIRRAEEVAVRRRIRENRTGYMGKIEEAYNEKMVNERENQALNINRNKKMSKFAKFSIQVLSSICIFGIVYYLGQNYSDKVNNVRPIFDNDIDIVAQASNIYSLTKSIFTGENFEYWKNKWRRE